MMPRPLKKTKKMKKINKKYRWIILLALFLSPAIYQTIRNAIYYRKVRLNGVYSICKIIGSEGRKGGKVVRIEYKFKNKAYVFTYPGNLGKSWIGESVFLKVLPTNPIWFIVLEDSIKPRNCIKDIPTEGWKSWDEIPKCK
jgi:hypothetical protein